MEGQTRTRVLVVANRTAATPRLMEAIRERRKRGPCEFALLIPDVSDRKRADWTLENALPLLRKAAGRPVEGIVGASGDPFASVQTAVGDGGFDEIIVSTLSKKTSKWLRRDLVRKSRGTRVAGDRRPASGGVRRWRHAGRRDPRRRDRWRRMDVALSGAIE